MARPRDEFDWNLVESLSMMEASEAFIAERLIANDSGEINAKSIQAKIKIIQRRIKERFECSFVQFRDSRVESQKIKLRSWQWKSAERGSVEMQKWLGKQYLGQVESVTNKLEWEEKKAKGLSDDDLKKAALDIIKKIEEKE